VTARADLERLAQIAQAQGRTTIEATCRRALTYLDALEAALRHAKGNAQQGARTRMARLTPAERQRIAATAAHRRWHPDASG
jgi:hypothetical protein